MGGIAVVHGLFDLQPSERLKRVRELAQEARESAAHAEDGMLEHRDSFIKIAEQWERMARELEATMSSDHQA